MNPTNVVIGLTFTSTSIWDLYLKKKNHDTTSIGSNLIFIGLDIL